MTNAVQAMGDEGTLALVIRRRRVNDVSSVEVSFADDGEGMDDETRALALAPFFTTRSTGTGLGLPIVARIVEAHGGTIDIQGGPGVGTTVTIVLPEQEGPPLTDVWGEPARISLLPGGGASTG